MWQTVLGNLPYVGIWWGKFHALSLSDIIREYIAEHNFKEDRDSLTHYSNFLKEQYGMIILPKEPMKRHKTQTNHIIFDSIRHPKEMILK